MRYSRIGEYFVRTGAFALAFILAACSTGPDYQRPSVDVPGGYKSALDSETTQPGLGRDWWRLFQDAELEALVQEALEANQSLKAAMARVAQARASASSVKSSFFPVVTLDPAATRSRTPVTTTSSDSASSKFSKAQSVVKQVSTVVGQLESLASGDATSGTSSGGVQSTTTSSGSSTSATFGNRFQIPFDLSYEIDAWGRVRRSYEAAQAQVRASECDFEVVRQTLLADLAQNFFTLRSLDEQDVILARNLALYEEQSSLTRKKCEAGLSNETDVLQATVQLETTRAQAADVRRQRADLEHAIAILVGRAPAQFTLAVRPLKAILPTVPAGLPSDLLQRRPDVAEAEQNLVAACAEIGVAKADFFPSIKLTGSAGIESSEIDDLFDLDNRFWSIGPSLSLPIFKGGQLRASLRNARARFDELEATYRQTVLGAFGDVEDSLTDLHLRAEQGNAQTKAVAAAREYLRLTQLQYDTGTVDYLQVVNAEQTLVSSELSEVEILNQRLAATILLIKALGGGWDPQLAVQTDTPDSLETEATDNLREGA